MLHTKNNHSYQSGPKILILEHDLAWIEQLQNAIRKRIRGAQTTVMMNEFAFRNNITELVSQRFSAAIFDICMPWADFDSILGGAMKHIPPEVQEEFDGRSLGSGGFRMQKILQQACSESGVNPPLPIFWSSVADNRPEESFGRMERFDKPRIDAMLTYLKINAGVR